MGRKLLCCWRYSILALFLLVITKAQAFHPEVIHRNHGFYTQHTVFTNPLIYPHQTARIPPQYFHHRGIFPPSGPQLRPHIFNYHQNHQSFNGGYRGENNKIIPFVGPLFRPAGGFETAETSGQLDNYNKALHEILEEQFGSTGGANDNNGGFNHIGGDRLNFSVDLLGGTSFVRVRQSFGSKNNNYNYQYAV